MKRISALGLDVGNKRIGVAGCDGLGLLATELDTIQRTSWKKDIDCLRYWVQEREAEILVIGLPYCMDGSLGFQGKQVQKFAMRVSKALSLPFDYVDERLTSVEAENQLKSDRRFSPQQDKALIDRRAAKIILQQWLDQRH
ncbi:MAG: Holliday junction resolvase RuvX [Microcystaceae cyanobacterium]